MKKQKVKLFGNLQKFLFRKKDKSIQIDNEDTNHNIKMIIKDSSIVFVLDDKHPLYDELVDFPLIQETLESYKFYLIDHHSKPISRHGNIFYSIKSGPSNIYPSLKNKYKDKWIVRYNFKELSPNAMEKIAGKLNFEYIKLWISKNRNNE